MSIEINDLNMAVDAQDLQDTFLKASEAKEIYGGNILPYDHEAMRHTGTATPTPAPIQPLVYYHGNPSPLPVSR